jgi:hypothetical protein
VNDKFGVITGLISMEVMKDAAVEHRYERLSRNLERHKISWNKLIGVTVDGSWNLTVKNVGRLVE